MAISPVMARKPTDAENSEAKALEDRIDLVLLGGGRVLQLRGWPSERVRKTIQERFRAAGWRDVKFDSDQREGEWLTVIE